MSRQNSEVEKLQEQIIKIEKNLPKLLDSQIIKEDINGLCKEVNGLRKEIKGVLSALSTIITNKVEEISTKREKKEGYIMKSNFIMILISMILAIPVLFLTQYASYHSNAAHAFFYWCLSIASIVAISFWGARYLYYFFTDRIKKEKRYDEL